ncbi:hypothetical protein NQ318_023240 [Aromia moschata]|uniref:Regulatory protein zeste n=1 Tax=Aromia moschata TaxID=1265417 RepID=A0AAV8XNB0_9CUCU|nr:hypothetical protein NQ318_023240 [Aromia moschata]
MAFKVRDAHWQILWKRWKKNPVIATGKFVGPQGRDTYRKLWAETTQKLNGHGFGAKTTEKWQKTWTYFKYNLKRKAAQIRKSLYQTGGGPSEGGELSELELKLLDILGENFVGIDQPELGLPTPTDQENIELQPSTSRDTSMEQVLPTLEPVPHQLNKGKRKRTMDPTPKEKTQLEYTQEYKDTINELQEIKTILQCSLSDVAQSLKDVAAELFLFNENLTQLLHNQQTYLESSYKHWQAKNLVTYKFLNNCILPLGNATSP